MRQVILRLMSKMIEKGAEHAYRKDQKPEAREIIENLPYCEDGIYEHQLDIIYPEVKQESYPVIVNIHGGGFGMNSKDKIYRNYGMRLAGDQFAVVNLNYRLSGTAVFPAQMEDVMAALHFLVKEGDKYKLDLKRVFLSGDSSGAYMAAMAACILKNQKLREVYRIEYELPVRAIALNCGMYDFTTFMGKEVHFPMKKLIVEMLFGSKNYTELNSFQYSSVFDYMTEDFPPAYLMDVEGESFAAEAYRMEKKLKSFKVPYQLHIFDKSEKLMHAFHIMSRFEQSNQVLQEMFQYFKKWY